VDNIDAACCEPLTFVGMRTALAALGLGISLTLAGLASCSSPPPTIQPPGPDPTSTPVFASDEEALAAAEELYGRYLAAENALGQGGWKDVSLVEPFVRGDALESERNTAADLSAKGLHQEGDIGFNSVVLQQAKYSNSGAVKVVVYLCLDFAAADVVNGHGDSAVDSGRGERLALEVQIDDEAGQLLISKSESWSGESFC